ncbi:fatty acid desaturase [Erythrobacter sp. WG]|uniref:fatty acid desaturase n=1 Tax=Erythrobacter sp. WG TaxID=2985510 RepID=UPI00226EF758|nr:fatty acid desaturase [Erythrobacter sp. WG]MCX9147859.1 fatty acid desaturase [Erythrobacter sp. WG]
MTIHVRPDRQRAAAADAAVLDPRSLVSALRPFTKVNTGRSIGELAVTLVPFFALVLAMLVAVSSGYVLALVLVPVAGLLLLRTFIIQHDCGHGAFLGTRTGNDALGRALGVLTFTPYDCWRRSHALHHATTGNLDARGFGDVDTLTVREFRSRGPVRRVLYRIYRHPIFLFGFGPAYLFVLRHRLPIGLMREGKRYWISALATNLATGGVLAGLMVLFGIAATVLVVVPTLLFAATTGVWLFYVQHQFERAHWNGGEEWSFHEAALHGSSHLDLPQPLRWFTGNIGIHHVHHLASRIPFYRLPDVLAAYPQLRDLNRLTIGATFKPMTLALWDEDQRRLVSFRKAIGTSS